MGIILSKQKDINYLEKYGFHKEKRNCIGTCENCYEKSIPIHDGLYYIWIAIDIEHNEIHYYVEYNCGGEIKRNVESIPEDISINDETAFMEWLDKNATDYSEIV